jgi:hypothetical protein
VIARLSATGASSLVDSGESTVCERLVLRDEAGERTPGARALRAFFGMFDDTAGPKSLLPPRRDDLPLTAAEHSDSVG